jgi:hypothetical protein
LKVTEVEDEKERETVVKLNSLREKYKVNCPKEKQKVIVEAMKNCGMA